MAVLEFDPTASLPANYIKDQVVTLSVGGTRVAVMPGGAFYKEGLLVRDGNSGRVLTPSLDYVPVHSIESILRKTGRVAYAALIIKSPGVSSIKVDSRYVGGNDSITPQLLQEVADIILSDTRQISVGMIYDLPTEYFPTQHTHSAEDISYPGMVAAIYSLVATASINTEQSLMQIYDYINRFGVELSVNYDDVDPSRWGVILIKSVNIQIAWGTVDAGQHGNSVRFYFKRAFTAKPAVLVGSGKVTSLGNRGRWLERENSTTSYSAVLRAFSDTDSGLVPGTTYFAIGRSTESQALAVNAHEAV